MARAALGWGMKELAEASGVSANTIDRFENGRAAPIPANLKALRQAFEAAGVTFTERGGVEPPKKGEA
jgi:transcriptional regulator with XRE-family HTH domain